MRYHLICSMTLALVSSAPVAAHAGPLDVWGFGRGDAARAGAYSTVGGGAQALHYNPGALTRAEPGVSVGLQSSFNRLQIRPAPRPSGYQVPDLGEDSPALPTASTGPTRPTDGVDPSWGVTLGLVGDLGTERFRVGATLYMPTTSALTMQTHFADERERYASNQLHFELLDARLRRFDLQAGAAWAPLDWLSVGAGAVVVPDARLTNDVVLRDPADQANAQINLRAETGAGLGWTAGGLITIGERVRLGASWRSAVAVELTGQNDILVLGTEGPDGQPQTVTQELSFLPSYTPARGALGLGWGSARVGVDLDVRYVRWSRYRDTQGDRAGFGDRPSAHLGGRFSPSARLDVLAGAAWIPTPVPEQTGRTNYVDASRAVLSGGASHRLMLGDTAARLGWFVQLHLLRERVTRKRIPADPPVCGPGVRQLCDEVPDDTADDRTGQPYPEAQGLQTGNPGFPGWAAGGWMGAAGVELSWGRQR